MISVNVHTGLREAVEFNRDEGDTVVKVDTSGWKPEEKAILIELLSHGIFMGVVAELTSSGLRAACQAEIKTRKQFIAYCNAALDYAKANSVHEVVREENWRVVANAIVPDLSFFDNDGDAKKYEPWLQHNWPRYREFCEVRSERYKIRSMAFQEVVKKLRADMDAIVKNREAERVLNTMAKRSSRKGPSKKGLLRGLADWAFGGYCTTKPEVTLDELLKDKNP